MINIKDWIDFLKLNQLQELEIGLSDFYQEGKTFCTTLLSSDGDYRLNMDLPWNLWIEKKEELPPAFRNLPYSLAVSKLKEAYQEKFEAELALLKKKYYDLIIKAKQRFGEDLDIEISECSHYYQDYKEYYIPIGFVLSVKPCNHQEVYEYMGLS